MLVAEHLRYRFDGCALRQADRSGERVPCLTGRNVIDSQYFTDRIDSFVDSSRYCVFCSKALSFPVGIGKMKLSGQGG